MTVAGDDQRRQEAKRRIDEMPTRLATKLETVPGTNLGAIFARLMRGAGVGLVTAATLFGNATGAVAAYKAEVAVPAGAPLSFGMSQDQAAAALGVPLGYIRGSHGNELLLALPNVKGSALTIRSDGLYLQFRRGRLTGWKGDWGTARPPFVGW